MKKTYVEMIFKNRESIEKYGENQSIYFVTKQSIWFVKKEGAFHFKRFQETILVGGILFILFFFDLFFYSFYVYIGNKEYLFLVIVLLCGRIALCCSTKYWNRRDRFGEYLRNNSSVFRKSDMTWISGTFEHLQSMR